MAVAFGNFEFDAEASELRCAGKIVALGGPRLRLLKALLERPGVPVSKEQLMAAAWGGQVSEGRLTATMTGLRKALGSKRAGSPIKNLPKVGYVFVGELIYPSRSGPAPQPLAPGAEPPYVGRGPVKERLREALARARGGWGCMTVLIGEPGIGKTRAVEELECELPSDVRSAWGCCRESGDTPVLWPWRELLDGMRARAEGAPQRTSDAESLASASAGTRANRHDLFERAAATVIQATDGAVWLLVLDDLHRADAASLELLLRVVDRISNTKIHLVATLRPYQKLESARHTALLAQVLEHKNCRRIALDRLSASDVAQFVTAQIDDPEGDIAQAVYQTSEGNPFFMTELVRQLGVTPALERPKKLSLPPGALGLMRQRVQDIDDRAHGLLSICAVIGRTIPLGLLADVVQRAHAELRDELEEAIRCDVMTALGPSLLRFDHELIRSVLYDQMAPIERRRWHVRVAQVMEASRRSGADIAASDVAFHCHAALPSGDLRMTIRVCREAADEAASVFGSTDVAHYTHYALEALRLLSRPSLRLRVSLLYGIAIYSRPYDTAVYARSVHELIELSYDSKNGEMLARASALLNAHPRLAPLPRTAAKLERALEWLPAHAHGLRALALSSQAVVAPTCFDKRRVVPLLRRAGDLVAAATAEAPAPAAPASSTSGRAVLRASARGRHAFYTALLHQLYFDGGDVARSRQIYARLEELARRSPAELSTLSIDLAFHRAATALSEGALEGAALALREARERARELTHAELLWHSERALALLDIEREGSRAACDALRVLHDRAAAQGIWGTAVFCAYDRCVYLGFEPCAAPELRAALASAPEDTPALWAMKLRGLTAAGDGDLVRTAFLRVPAASLPDLPHDGDYVGTLGHLTHAAVSLNAVDYYPVLEALLGEQLDLLSAQLLGGCAGPVAFLLGMLACASGRYEQAVQHLERTLEVAVALPLRSLEARLWLIRSLLGLGDAKSRRRALAMATAVHRAAEALCDAKLQTSAARLLEEASSGPA